MPEDEGDATVTDRHSADETLREAFRSLGDRSRDEPSSTDLDRVWRAVSGELPAAERRELVDRMASDPALAESWRVAHELHREASERTPVVTTRGVRLWTRSWVAAAAVLLLAVAVGITVRLWQPAGGRTFRDSGQYAVGSLVPSDSLLPRDAFQLRWTPGPEGSRYQVRVTTEDLRVLTNVSDLTTPELLVGNDVLSGVAPGSRVFWQVDVMLPQGNTIQSQTFVVRVQ
jgi:hypothetical protein